MHHLDEHKRAFKTMRRKETIGLRRMASDEDMLEKNMWFHLGANTCLQMIYALERATEVAVEHVDNNYNPIPEEYRAEFAPIRDRVIDYIAQVHQLISSKRMEDAKKAKNMGKELREIVKDMRKTQMKRAHKGRREDCVPRWSTSTSSSRPTSSSATSATSSAIARTSSTKRPKAKPPPPSPLQAKTKKPRARYLIVARPVAFLCLPPDDGTDLNTEGACFGSPLVTSPKWGKRRRLPRYHCSSGGAVVYGGRQWLT